MSKRFNSFMAIAFAVLMAWPTSASAQFLAPGPAAKAMKSQKATTDIRKKDAKASKFKAMPLPRQAKQSSIGIQRRLLSFLSLAHRPSPWVAPKSGV